MSNPGFGQKFPENLRINCFPHDILTCYILIIDPNTEFSISNILGCKVTHLSQTFTENANLFSESQTRKTFWGAPIWRWDFWPCLWGPGPSSSLESNAAPLLSNSSAALTLPINAALWSGVLPQGVGRRRRCWEMTTEVVGNWAPQTQPTKERWMFWTQHLQICSKQKHIYKHTSQTVLRCRDLCIYRVFLNTTACSGRTPSTIFLSSGDQIALHYKARRPNFENPVHDWNPHTPRCIDGEKWEPSTTEPLKYHSLMTLPYMLHLFPRVLHYIMEMFTPLDWQKLNLQYTDFRFVWT